MARAFAYGDSRGRCIYDTKIEPMINIPDFVFNAILKQRQEYEKNCRRRRTMFLDLNYICCSTYGRPRSRQYHSKKFKRILAENGLPHIILHQFRNSFCTMLLKNDFISKTVSKVMGHAKEIIMIDVYGDTPEVIEDWLNVIQPYIEEVILKSDGKSTDYSEKSIFFS